MHDDVASPYHGPSFQFYAADFIADTMQLSADEIGAYMLLICHAWEHGGIPNDIARIAKIARLPRRRAEAVWGSLEPYFSLHESVPNLLIQSRLEKVREAARIVWERQVNNGRKGGRPRNPRVNPGETHGLNAGPEKQNPRVHSGLTQTKPKRNPNESPREVITPPSLRSGVVSCASLRSAQPASEPQAGTHGFQPKGQTKLDLDAIEARGALLRAIWDCLAETPYSATISRTEWGKRNARAAADLVRLGMTPEQAVAAWRSASERLGAPARTVAIVQDELGRQAVPPRGAGPRPKRDHDRGEEMDRQFDAMQRRQGIT